MWTVAVPYSLISVGITRYLQLSCSIYHVSPRISHKWWLSKRCRPRNIFYCGGEGAQRRNAGDTAIKCGGSQRAGSVMRRVVCLVPGQSGVSERDFGPDPVGRYQLPMAELHNLIMNGLAKSSISPAINSTPCRLTWILHPLDFSSSQLPYPLVFVLRKSLSLVPRLHRSALASDFRLESTWVTLVTSSSAELSAMMP